MSENKKEQSAVERELLLRLKSAEYAHEEATRHLEEAQEAIDAYRDSQAAPTPPPTDPRRAPMSETEDSMATESNEKAQTPDCKCPTPEHTGRGTCQRCAGFACEYADRGRTRCPSWRCDCFIETHPFDNPQGLHPEAFIVGPVIPTGGPDA